MSESQRSSDRRKDLDRLRIAACLSTFFFHTSQIYDFSPLYHVKTVNPSAVLDVVSRLLHVVRMPLFFLIAGMVGYLALKRYTNLEFMKQRALRLLPPFLIGIIFLTPIIKYVELLDGRHITWKGLVDMPASQMPDVLTFLRRFYTQFKWFSWSHMWFPLCLFLLGTILLPFQRLMLRATWRLKLPGLVLIGLLAILVTIELVLRPYFPSHIPNIFWDWASVSVYAIMLMAGCAFIQWPEIEDTLQRCSPLLLLTAVIGAVIYINYPDWPLKGIGRALTAWGFLCWVIGMRPLLSRGRLAGETYMSEAVLPLYVLHHVPLVLIAFFVKDTPWPLWERYFTIVLGAFILALAIYHFLVLPYNPMRRAFGLRPHNRQPQPQAPTRETAPA